MIHIFTVVTGNTLNSHKTFLEHLAAKTQLTEVKGVEECDVIVAFCPISSRPGTDIEAALLQIPDDKPSVLVVLHHTCDPNHILTESSRYVSRSDVLTVDCLFHDTEGLLKCQINEEAMGNTLRCISQHSKVLYPHWQSQEPPNFQEFPEQGSSKVIPEDTSSNSRQSTRRHCILL
ncbi:hypothetical protein AGOR_G00084480 [Albula goreensis]|uniref:Uncharacterized protein n=1 Tax=Albula goreensis TaxID=1534307 RepID=A0A8T3DNI6_9TELE|nr:hypothetical protein AGOR_G00084480 [Albula goreensis]